MVLLARAMKRIRFARLASSGSEEEEEEEAATEKRTRRTPPPPFRTLHPLGAPFTDQGGPALVSQFTFAEDNTLADTPMVGLLNATRNWAREKLAGGHEQLTHSCA